MTKFLFTLAVLMNVWNLCRVILRYFREKDFISNYEKGTLFWEFAMYLLCAISFSYFVLTHK